MPRTSLPPDDILGPFSASTHTYKTVDGHAILADVLIPKKLLELGRKSEDWHKPRPVIVRIHGGFLIGGQREHAEWIPLWLYSLGYHHNAIIVSPDYRLLPEASAVDILDDLDDLWKWVGTELPSVVRDQSKPFAGTEKGLEVDLDKVLVGGESAGGYCATQLALSNFTPIEPGVPSELPRMRALVAVYPMLDMRAPHWTQSYHKQIFDIPQFPESIVNDHLKAVRESSTKPILSNVELGPGRARTPLMFASVQHGRFEEFLGPERDNLPGKRKVYPFDRIEDGAKLPPSLFIHGLDDTGVPISGTDKFVTLIQEHESIVSPVGRTASDSLMYVKVPGEHGFENLVGPEDPNSTWVKGALDFIEGYWLD